jgi:hypothetical protein
LTKMTVSGSVPITRYRGNPVKYYNFYHASLRADVSGRYEDELGDVPLS